MIALSIDAIKSQIPFHNGCGGVLDSPKVETTSNSVNLRIAGWFAIKTAHSSHVIVETNGFCIQINSCFVRDDVIKCGAVSEEYVPYGFDLFVTILDIPKLFSINISCLQDDGGHIPLFSIAGRHFSLCDSSSSALKPASIVGLGRSGTTWLMRLLLQHPLIVGATNYPYEAYVSRYFVQVMRNMISANSKDEILYNFSSLIANITGSDGMTLGKNPFNSHDYLEYDVIGTLSEVSPFIARRCALEMIDAYYKSIAKSQGRDDAIYYVEKTFIDCHAFRLGNIYERQKCLFLVRDPRDIFRSRRSFNGKRGIKSFGERIVEDDRQWVDVLSLELLQMRQLWDLIDAENRLTVRYEDLLTTPEIELRRILAFLELPHGSTDIGELLAAAHQPASWMDAHRTSPAESSIGRWRSEMEPELVQRLDAGTQQFRRHFGYQADSGDDMTEMGATSLSWAQRLSSKMNLARYRDVLQTSKAAS
ncbi:MAG: sulfotransferase [Azospirillaceae bacterium]|nr:sulfotransferase [Azospirillaceae bacterium]